jgi:hypothetical protein
MVCCDESFMGKSADEPLEDEDILFLDPSPVADLPTDVELLPVLIRFGFNSPSLRFRVEEARRLASLLLERRLPGSSSCLSFEDRRTFSPLLLLLLRSILFSEVRFRSLVCLVSLTPLDVVLPAPMRSF